MIGRWIRKPRGGGCVIFVHGILSSGETCWKNKNGCYWPELLKKERGLNSLGVYVFTYEIGIFSGSYRLSDVVDALKEFMKVDKILTNDYLVFVCHSMGGIVVRKFLIEQAIQLSTTDILLFLIASPSLGSDYADWLHPLSSLFGHAQAEVLRFVRNNVWLQDLDKEFLNLKESRRLNIRGKELVEDKFIILNKLLRRQVVEPFSGAHYFGEPFKVPASDHFSIAKPGDKTAIQHRLLCQFIRDNPSFRKNKQPNANQIVELETRSSRASGTRDLSSSPGISGLKTFIAKISPQYDEDQNRTAALFLVERVPGSILAAAIEELTTCFRRMRVDPFTQYRVALALAKAGVERERFETLYRWAEHPLARKGLDEGLGTLNE